MEEKYLVYENWNTAKAVVHKGSCGYAKAGVPEIAIKWLEDKNNHSENGRWFVFLIPMRKRFRLQQYFQISL